ncbi:MAG: ribonuclease HII [Candidatus Micrarchaeaceae archaeon]
MFDLFNGEGRMIICGGDEAGRGALLGPLVVSIVGISSSGARKLAEIGVRDSKLLSPKRREELFDKIRGIATAIEVDVINASEINDAMEKGISLNELEASRFAKLFDRVEKDVGTIYLDSPDVIEERFGMRVSMYSKKPIRVDGIRRERKPGIKYTKLVSEHKADVRYPVVSASSIISKVIRDLEIKKLEDASGIELGSGYPSDFKTIDALRKNIGNQYLEKHIRRYWKTVDRIRQTKLSYF